jgi:hypothetical protein
MHLIDYIGHSDYFPKSLWDGSRLEVYASSYITTHYDLFTKLCNNEKPITDGIQIIYNNNEKVIPKNHKIVSAHTAFLKNPELVFRHRRSTKFFSTIQ